jgi:formate dehydrogenase subunit gamma
MQDIQYKRHDRSDIIIHWWNGICWLVLLVTGIGLISNPELDPLGAWYPETVRNIFGGGSSLLAVHIVWGVLWIVGFLLYLAVNIRGAVFFLREVFSVDRSRDLSWMFRKMVRMTLGPRVLKSMTGTTELPDQGFYNMGQKGFAQVAVLGGVLIAVTGVIMAVSSTVIPEDLTWLVSWSVTLHYLGVGVVFAGLLVHIYMAAISPEERPGLRSMFTGSVPARYARHHHRLWYDRVSGKENGRA